MGLLRIVTDLDLRRAAELISTAIKDPRIAIRDYWRGWGEKDVESLTRKLDEPHFYDGGLLKLTNREYRALPELNRRVTAAKQSALTSPIVVWVQGRGLFSAIRKH